MQQSFCILGNGGKTPSVNKLALSNGQLQIACLSGFSEGQSVYRVALSPSGLMVAAATKLGNIKVLKFHESGAGFVSEFQYRTTQSPHVTGLSFVNDDILIASGTDSRIRVLSIKTKERIKLIFLPGIAFALTVINSELFACICRQGGTDHLMVWNLQTEQKIFEGPAFKINSEYLLAPLTIDDQSGYLAHSDRYGNAYLYNINNGFQLKSFDSGHGDFYGLLLNNGIVYTAGFRDNGKIKQWSIDSVTAIGEAPPIQSPIMALSKFDVKHFLSVSAQGQILLYSYQGLEIKERTQLNNLRHITALPTSLIIKINRGERSAYLDSMVRQIKDLFEGGQNENARQLIIRLESEGFDIEVLKILAIAEKAQGLMLAETETLLMLLKKNPQGDELIGILNRLAEIFEQIHEPEMAIHSLKSLIEASGNQEPFTTKINALRSRCIPEVAQHVLLTGFPSVDMVKPEFRKAELLGRCLQAAISWEPEKVSATISMDIKIDDVAQALSGKVEQLFKTSDIIPVFIKAGHNIVGPIDMLRLQPVVNLPHFVELWVEIRRGMDENKHIFHRVFYPNATEYTENWNLEMLDLFENVLANPMVTEWYTKTENQVVKAMVTINEIDDDDNMFKIHKSR